MRILIIANSRFKGGTSGGDKIYESFQKYWPECSFSVWTMLDIDYKPFLLCYIHRIIIACIIAVFERRRYDIVYSASDFIPDSIPALLYKIKHKTKWIAGFYLKAFRENRLHFFSQKLVIWLIKKYADMVIVTNKTMYDIFPNKKKTWINGGVDLDLAGLSDEPKIYDAVFVGRIHPSKGIDELIATWKLVRENKPDAQLAIIGDGDLGIFYIKDRLGITGVHYFGYMGDERYDIYKQSKVVLNPTPEKYDHFSMSYVEAMACGCRLVCYNTPVIRSINPPRMDIDVYAIKPQEIDVNQDINIDWASQFDYKAQSLRVYEDIRKVIYEDIDYRQ